MSKIKVARVYLRVSTQEQELARQDSIIDDAKAAGFYVAGVYCGNPTSGYCFISYNGAVVTSGKSDMTMENTA